MLGVGGNSASKTLSLHLGLDNGTGLTIYHVVPESAAHQAGIKAHDIITAINGKAIGSQNDLRAEVLAHKPGDEVTVKLIREGKQEEKKVILGARVVEPRAGRDRVRERRGVQNDCLLYTSPSPRDQRGSRMPSSA